MSLLFKGLILACCACYYHSRARALASTTVVKFGFLKNHIMILAGCCPISYQCDCPTSPELANLIIILGMKMNTITF